MKKINVKEIDHLYYYDKDDLGHRFKNNRHIFKVWSPLADNMTLCIYDSYRKDNKIDYIMERSSNGIWKLEITKDLNGKYYTFISSIDNISREAVDPYARALSVNGELGSIINMESTNPDNWESQKRPRIQNPTDAVIYETNVRDISIDNNSGIKNKGRYLGLSEENTVGVNGIKTGLSHIKDLGVTHIQLMPIYDFASIDESIVNPEGEFENSRSYNWGYDPSNYNVPEGSYSSDPYNPSSRIKELKIAIKTIHENGLGVIMDVVYNHMYEVEKSGFHKLMPGYFFRYDESGNLANESMCGNVLASENAMVRKFIVDSVKYWAREYKIDGFRFDLMGLIDVGTMNQIREELNKIDPTIIILGEGWDMSKLLKKEDRAIQTNAYKLKNIAFFNDSIRDILRGSPFIEEDYGLLGGKENKEDEIKKSIVAGIKYSKGIELWGEVSPNQVVNYVECHDNHTLYDKLRITVKSEKKVKDMHRLGTSIVLLSQGIPFLHAGQEFLRTKNGVENSYNSNDSINKMDWNRKYENMDTVEYVKGLIKLRKSHPAFRMTNEEDIRRHLEFIDAPKNSVAYLIKDNANGDKFNEILVIHNANEDSVEINLKINKKWAVLVDKKIASEKGFEIIEGDKIRAQGISTLVATNII